MVTEEATYRANLLTGIGELTSQAKVKHVAGPTSTGKAAHGEVGLK